MEIISIKTTRREQLIDITAKVREVVKNNKWEDGILYIYCPHTTGGITINESADPSVAADIEDTLMKLIPRSRHYKHIEGNSDSHIKSSIIGCGSFCFVERGDLVLGTWQGIFFAEFDGPRNRKVYLKFIRS